MQFKNREEYDKNMTYNTKENCYFCSENLPNTNEILHITDFWIIIFNKFPYFEYDRSLLVIPKRHIEFTVELNQEELLDFLEVEKYLKEYYKYDDYFSFIRQSKSNKSVEHLHYHYMRWIPSARVIDWENYFLIKNKSS